MCVHGMHGVHAAGCREWNAYIATDSLGSRFKSPFGRQIDQVRMHTCVFTRTHATEESIGHQVSVGVRRDASSIDGR